MSAARQAPHARKIAGQVELTGPFFNQMRKRKKQGRDAKIFVTGKSETGIGKTHCATSLGYLVDTSTPTPIGETGFEARFRPEKCTVWGPEWINLYDKVQEGSAIIGDEWTSEGDTRRSNSTQNVQMSYQWAMRRYREIIGIIILPSRHDLDKRLQRLADYWVLVEERGKATIYEVRVNELGSGGLWFEELQTFSWPNLDNDPVIDWLDYAKEAKAEDGQQHQFYDGDTVEQLEKEARMEGHEEARLTFVMSALDRGLRQKDVAEMIGVSRSRVSQLKTKAQEQGVTAATA